MNGYPVTEISAAATGAKTYYAKWIVDLGGATVTQITEGAENGVYKAEDAAKDEDKYAIAYKAAFNGLDNTKKYVSPTLTWIIDHADVADEVGKRTQIIPVGDINAQSEINYGLVITGNDFSASGQSLPSISASLTAASVTAADPVMDGGNN